MSRVAGWEQRLTDVLASAATRSFAYGSYDCCLFACDVIAALTGVDPGRAFRGTYLDKDECSRVLTTNGGILGIAQRVAKDHGFTRVPVHHATRGSIVLGQIDNVVMLGVCTGAKVAFARFPRGLYYVKRTDAALRCAWEIG